jgi:hypothetical protein
VSYPIYRALSAARELGTDDEREDPRAGVFDDEELTRKSEEAY